MKRNPSLLVPVLLLLWARVRRDVGREGGPGRISDASSEAQNDDACRHLVGKYSGAFTGTFTLHWTQTGSALGGSITLSSPSGKYGVSGSVHGTAISFGAVGAGATYTGSVSGDVDVRHLQEPCRRRGSWSAQKT